MNTEPPSSIIIPFKEFNLESLVDSLNPDTPGTHIIVERDVSQRYTIWVAYMKGDSIVSLAEACDLCDMFMTGSMHDSQETTAVMFTTAYKIRSLKNKDKGNTKWMSYLVVIQRMSTTSELGQSLSSPLYNRRSEIPSLIEAILSRVRKMLGLLESPQYHTLDTHIKVREKTTWASIRLYLLIGILAITGLFTTALLYSANYHASYERYPTPGSEGPKHQSRLAWTNATAWARKVHYNQQEWRVRIDDQALVPADLYDEDEEHYQKWFRRRYPHMQDLVDRMEYIHPAWLGSENIAVPWDAQFHFAHCVLALRRYWKAKESGHHVCGRDIDYAHMKHCLDSLDAKAFPPGPMTEYGGEGFHLWWQTKVCY